MKLQHLFASLTQLPENSFPHIEVSGVQSDARLIQPSGVFVAIPGTKVDGHNFIQQAVDNGAAALVVKDRNKVPDSFQGFLLVVDNPREVLDHLAARFNWDPAEELFCVGITGTNGKTSVTYLVECLFNFVGKATGVIGTINHHLLDKVWPSEMTTPGPVDLQKRLREFKEAGALAVAMEVSSHALDQARVDSVSFDVAVFTNLTRDHLDYHGTMEKYLEAKQRLFTDLMWKTRKKNPLAVVNIEDEFGRRLKVAGPAQIWTYGDLKKSPEADLKFFVKEMSFVKTIFSLETPKGNIDIHLPMSGVHNVLNATAAIGVALRAGLTIEQCAEALHHFKGVPGRLESVETSSDISAFVDYAHTPDALENVLLALRKVREGLGSSGENARIWTVFGCGGDRDKGKRPLMAQVAWSLSDQVVITSDNPRTEDPNLIVQDIRAGIPATDPQALEGHPSVRLKVEVDREKAIQWAIDSAAPGDVILIAGKGHEDYQIVGDVRLSFSDYKIALSALQKRK